MHYKVHPLIGHLSFAKYPWNVSLELIMLRSQSILVDVINSLLWLNSVSQIAKVYKLKHLSKVEAVQTDNSGCTFVLVYNLNFLGDCLQVGDLLLMWCGRWIWLVPLLHAHGFCTFRVLITWRLKQSLLHNGQCGISTTGWYPLASVICNWSLQWLGVRFWILLYHVLSLIWLLKCAEID